MKENDNINQLSLWDLRPEKAYMNFRKAREFARSLNLHNQEEWEDYISRWQLTNGGSKKIIPLKPDITYRHSGWIGWNDWLGLAEDEERKNENMKEVNDLLFSEGTLWNAKEKSSWLPFREARMIVRQYGFEYEEEWNIFIKGKLPKRTPLPADIPQNPDQMYRLHGWKGWNDWLVDPDKKIEYAGFYQARDFARSLRINNQIEWRPFIKQNAALLEEYQMVLPERPHLEYREKGWKNWEDWLGKQIKFKDFQTTRKFVHSLKLNSRNDWKRYCSGQLLLKSRRSENIYAYPEIAYKDEGWKDWSDWLGYGNEKSGERIQGIPVGAVECRCGGQIENCPDCDGKGYYYK